MKTQLKKHTIEQDTWKVNNALQEQLNVSKLLSPSRPEKRDRTKGRNEKPRITSREKKYRKKSFQFKSESASLFLPFFFLYLQRQKKPHRYRLTKGITRLLSCTEQGKTFHTPFLNCQWINTCIISIGLSIFWQLY